MYVTKMLNNSAAGFEFQSMLDGSLGHNQNFIAEEDVPKMALCSPRNLGTYEWVVMPFGLKNAGGTYQRVMNSIFDDYIETSKQFYIAYVVIKSFSRMNHLEHLWKSLERMRKHILKMNPLKYAFCVQA